MVIALPLMRLIRNILLERFLSGGVANLSKKGPQMAEERDREPERVEAESSAPAAATGSDAGAPGGMGGAAAVPVDSGGRPNGGVSPIPAEEDEDR